jgi:hypothetical protein
MLVMPVVMVELVQQIQLPHLLLQELVVELVVE